MTDGSALVEWAADVAGTLMPQLGRRWAHVQSVAELASKVAVILPSDPDRLVAAAYLHDIGYVPEVADTGFHPLDGGRFLRSEGHEELALVVAHHTNARGEARLRGFSDYEYEFPFPDSLLSRAVTYCDFSISPDGNPISLEDRIAEIVARYGQQNVTARAVVAGLPEFRAIRADVEGRLRAAGVTP